MATPPNFQDLQRNIHSAALKFASVESKIAGGAGAQVGRGNYPPTPTPTPSQTAPPPPSPTPSGTPAVTPSVTVTISPEPPPTPEPTPSFTPTPSITPEGTPAPTPTPSGTPGSTPTPTPTVTPAPKSNWEYAIYGPIPNESVPFVQEGITVLANVPDVSVLYYDTDDTNVYGDYVCHIYVDNVSKLLFSFGGSRLGTMFAFEVPGDSRKFYGEFAASTYTFFTSAYPPQPNE